MGKKSIILVACIIVENCKGKKAGIVFEPEVRILHKKIIYENVFM